MSIYILVAANARYAEPGFSGTVAHWAVANDETGTVVHNSPEHPGVLEMSIEAFWIRYFERYGNLQASSISNAVSDCELYIVEDDFPARGKMIWRRAKDGVGKPFDKETHESEEFVRWTCQGTDVPELMQSAIEKQLGAVTVDGMALHDFKNLAESSRREPE